MSIQDKVRGYITEFITYGESIEDDQSLIESGMVDSTGAMELVAFIEEEFGIEIPNEDIGPDILDSVNKITTYVESHAATSNVA